MSFPNMTPDPIKELRKETQRQREITRGIKESNEILEKAVKDGRRLSKYWGDYWRAKDAEWKPKTVEKTNIGTIQPAHSQFQYRQVQQTIDTSNDTGNPVTQSVKTVQPVTHHVKAVFVFLGCLAITIVLGLFIGSMSDSNFNLANAAGVWVGGLYITYEITKWTWRKHDG